MSNYELEQEAEKLAKAVKPFFRAFCNGYIKEGAHINVSKQKRFWLEQVWLAETNNLCCLQINRRYNLDYPDTEDSLEIIIKWFDYNDSLVYRSEYFAQMSNEAVIKKTRELLKVADKLAKQSHQIGRKENERQES